MPDRLLLHGGYIVSVDPEIGDINGGDVLIEGDTIAAVAPKVEATEAEVIDVTGDVVIPGFIDSHRHTWETSIRGTAPNATLDDYFGIVLDGFARVYRPEDVYVANYMGALECINAGVTTLLDWSHIQNTPDHSDQAIRGLQETGIRSVFAYGFPNTSLADWWYDSSLKTPDDVRRVRETYFSSDDGLITMALATRGPGFSKPEVVKHEWALARELDLPITMHVGMGRVAGRFSMVSQLNELGLLGPDTTYIHSCYLSEDEWKLVADTGGKISIAAQVELQMGHGCPPTLRARELGLRPSLSVDVVTTVPGDMFTEMRAMFGSERFGVNAECWTADVDAPDTMLTARDVLKAATIDGAYVCGLEDRTGSLTPGKKADVVVIDGKSPNVLPIVDPVATVVLCADVSNVDTVIIDGKIHKQNGRLLADYDHQRVLIDESRDFLIGNVERDPNWMVPPAV
jgi:cytosine/adenosine deaminase-related metal-dependent hydrolase